METNYPSSGNKGSAGMPGTNPGVTGGGSTLSGTSTTGSAGNVGGSGISGSPGSKTSTETSTWSTAGGYQGGQGGAGGSSSLRDELSSLKRDLDDLVSRAASLSDRELSDARDKMMTKFGSMRTAARGVADQARTQLNQGMDVTSDYVKDKPLQSVAIAAGVGLLVGALMRGGRD